MENRVKLEWSEKADARLEGIIDYYEDKDPVAGYRIVSEIEERAKSIKSNPEIGVRSHKKKGIRRLIVSKTKYFIAYKLLPNSEKPKIAYITAVVSSLDDTEVQKYL